jgi:hypothetical protein
MSKYRIVEEIEKDGLGNTESVFYIQRRTWLRWKKHSLPFLEYYGLDGITIKYGYPVGSKDSIENILNDVKKEENYIRYNGTTIKKVYISNTWEPKWIINSDYKITSWGAKYYTYGYDLKTIKEIIDRRKKTKTTRIVD